MESLTTLPTTALFSLLCGLFVSVSARYLRAENPPLWGAFVAGLSALWVLAAQPGIEILVQYTTFEPSYHLALGLVYGVALLVPAGATQYFIVNHRGVAQTSNV